MSLDRQITKARADLIMGHPFFGALALRLKMVEDPSIKTSTCDGTTIRYNPEYLNGLSYDKLKGLLAHSVMHPAFLHHTRRGSRDPAKWNAACDYAINPILEQAKFALPTGKYSDPQYHNMTAEHIYSLLPDEPKDDQNSPDPDPGGDGGVSDSPNGQSQSQQGAEEAEWKTAVAQAAHVAKQAGKLPSLIERMLEELFEPVLPWRAIMRRFMTERHKDDFSWSRGNRRFISQGLYLPSRISDPAMGPIVVVVDTSGSITHEQFAAAGSEITGIVAEVRPEKTYVMYCHSAVSRVDEFGPDDPVEFHKVPTGGTDFRPPFAWLEERSITPRALIYITDGYGPFPEEAAFPVLWCINNHDVVPPHGEHLILEI